MAKRASRPNTFLKIFLKRNDFFASAPNKTGLESHSIACNFVSDVSKKLGIHVDRRSEPLSRIHTPSHSHICVILNKNSQFKNRYLESYLTKAAVSDGHFRSNGALVLFTWLRKQRGSATGTTKTKYCCTLGVAFHQKYFCRF